MVPSHFLFLQTFPRTPNQKVDRKALAAIEPVSPESKEMPVLPQTEVEKKLAEIWIAQLKLEKVGIHDNFFDLGGYSLLMVQIHQKVQAHFGKKISIVELFRQPIIHLLASYLTEKENTLANIAPKRERPPGRKAGLREQQEWRRRHRKG